MAKAKPERQLHGNQAQVDPQQKIVGANVTNTVTMATKKGDKGSSRVEDQNVKIARDFSQENKK